VAVKQQYPNRELPKTKIPSILHSLKKQGKLKVVAERVGKKGFTYTWA